MTILWHLRLTTHFKVQCHSQPVTMNSRADRGCLDMKGWDGVMRHKPLQCLFSTWTNKTRSPGRSLGSEHSVWLWQPATLTSSATDTDMSGHRPLKKEMSFRQPFHNWCENAIGLAKVQTQRVKSYFRTKVSHTCVTHTYLNDKSFLRSWGQRTEYP